MSWYDTTNTGGMRAVNYDPTTTRNVAAEAEGREVLNTNNKYKMDQTRNLDAAFTESVEKQKVTNPDGSETYSLYLDPDKYSQNLFKRSKETGIPFTMEDAQKYGNYALTRMQTTSQMIGQAKGQEQQGIKVEGKPTPTQTTTIAPSVGTVGETRKGRDGKTYIFDGKGWYREESVGGF